MQPSRPLVVVQNNHVQRLTGPLARWAREQGVALHDVSSGGAAEAAPLPQGGPWAPVLVVSSILFVQQWSSGDPELARWVFWEDDAFDAAVWADRLGPLYMNYGGRATTVGDHVSSECGPMHVRPRSGIKLVGERIRTESDAGFESIPGIVATPAELAARSIDGETPIWISDPVDIRAEVRVWMIDGSPAAASTYRVDGAHVRDRSHPLVGPAVERARRVASVWTPHTHYVVDMALVGENWRMVEFNPIHSSGWYDADPGEIARAYLDAEGERRVA